MEFVQEAVGQALPTPNIFYDPIDSSDTPQSDADCNTFAEKRKKLSYNKPSAKRKLPQSLTINVNYVYGNGLDITTTTNSSSVPKPTYTIEYPGNKENTQTSSTPNKNNTSTLNLETNLNTSNNSLPDSTINSTIDLTQNDANTTTTNTECPVITYNFDWGTKTLQPAFDTSSCIIDLETTQPTICSSPTHTTIEETITNISATTLATPRSNISPKHIDTKAFNKSDKQCKRKFKTSKKLGSILKLNKKIQLIATCYRQKRHLQRRCEQLITTYSLHLESILTKYKKHSLIQYYYRNFKALELYTELLKGLKSYCSKNFNNMSQTTTNNSPSTLKRSRNCNSEDDNSPSSARQVRKLNRQEENFRHMLLPDSPEETNRKDASKYSKY